MKALLDESHEYAENPKVRRPKQADTSSMRILSLFVVLQFLRRPLRVKDSVGKSRFYLKNYGTLALLSRPAEGSCTNSVPLGESRLYTDAARAPRGRAL
jgi:hypothetical protein